MSEGLTPAVIERLREFIREGGSLTWRSQIKQMTEYGVPMDYIVTGMDYIVTGSEEVTLTTTADKLARLLGIETALLEQVIIEVDVKRARPRSDA